MLVDAPFFRCLFLGLNNSVRLLLHLSMFTFYFELIQYRKILVHYLSLKVGTLQLKVLFPLDNFNQKVVVYGSQPCSIG